MLPVLSKRFPKVQFEEFDPQENFPKEKEPVFLDTVVGVKKVEIIYGTQKFVLPKQVSMHDFDLATNLVLMQKAGLLKKFKIIGVPPHLKENKAIKQVSAAIKSSLL